MCAIWFHTECDGIKKDVPVGVWSCLSCRLIPAQVRNLLNTLNAVNMNSCERRSTLCEAKTQECDAVKDDNTCLQSQVASLTTRLSNKSWEYYTYKPTLLIGDSLISGVKEKDYTNTMVTSMSGAKIRH